MGIDGVTPEETQPGHRGEGWETEGARWGRGSRIPKEFPGEGVPASQTLQWGRGEQRSDCWTWHEVVSDLDQGSFCRGG